MNQEILALCRAMGSSQDQEELLLPLIQAVYSQLARRLKAEVFPEDCGPAFPLAAAMIAMDRLSNLTDSGGAGAITAFTAGDLTIRRESGSGGQKQTRTTQAEELLSPWLEDAGFVFQGVPG